MVLPLSPTSINILTLMLMNFKLHFKTEFYLLHEYTISNLYLDGARCSSVVRTFAYGSSDRYFMVDPLSYFSFQLVLYERCNRPREVYIKEPLLLIGKSSRCGGNGFPLSLSEWSFTICPTSHTVNKMC